MSYLKQLVSHNKVWTSDCEGRGKFQKFREACRNHPALISCQNDFMVPSYDPQKSFKQFNTYRTNLYTKSNHPICERYATPTKIFSHAKHIHETCLSINTWVSDGPVPLMYVRLFAFSALRYFSFDKHLGIESHLSLSLSLSLSIYIYICIQRETCLCTQLSM